MRNSVLHEKGLSLPCIDINPTLRALTGKIMGLVLGKLVVLGDVDFFRGSLVALLVWYLLAILRLVRVGFCGSRMCCTIKESVHACIEGVLGTSACGVAGSAGCRKVRCISREGNSCPYQPQSLDRCSSSWETGEDVNCFLETLALSLWIFHSSLCSSAHIEELRKTGHSATMTWAGAECGALSLG